MKRYASKVLFFFALLLNFSALSVEPFSLYLTWKQKPQSSISIQWLSSPEDDADIIEYQMEGDSRWHHGSGEHRSMPFQQPFLIHSVELTGLRPASTYFFRIGTEGKIYKFRTMPIDLREPIRFVVGGDMYNGTIEMLKKTNLAAAATSPLFVLIGGDIAYSAQKLPWKSENTERWLDWLKVWKETMVTPEGFLIPFVPAIGNHEVCGGTNRQPKDAECFYALFPMPGIRGYNVLDFANYMSLIILDSGQTNSISGTQTEWLKEVLSQRVNVPHKFAVYHIPAYPSYRNYNATDSRAIRQNWVPLFEQFGLHAAFENNDHAYKRTHLILRGRPQTNGVLYLGDGAWSVENVRKPKTPKNAWYIAKSSQNQYFMVVTLQGIRRTFRAYSPEGILIDEVCQ